MKNVVWSDSALEDVAQIAANVAEYTSPVTAERYISEFNRLVELAAFLPEMGKIGLRENTRELYPINGMYRIVYHVSGNDLVVLSVVMSMRQYP